MPFMVDYSADIQISECMNDIINQVETREWRNVIQHRDRILKKWTKSKAKVEEMKDDWEVATEKIAQENSDLHNEIKKLKVANIHTQTIYNGRYVKYENEIKKLKKENKDMKQNLDYWMKEGFSKDNLKKEIEKLQNRIEDAEQRGFDEGRDQYQVDSEYLDEKEDEIKRLRELIEKRDQEIKAVKEANVMFMKRYEKKVEEEKKINEVCSRIQCEDTFGHLIGRIPTDK